MTALDGGIVILGSGLGGYSLAREFRKLDRKTPVTVVTADGGEAYSKPMLSNAFAQGKTPAALVQKTAEQIAAELSLTVLPRSRAVAIDRDGKQVAVKSADGAESKLAYGRLVFAIGADPRPYRVEGSDQVTVHSVNDLDDYASWRAKLGVKSRVLLIGAGLIGAEFANDLAGAGHQVTVVDPAPWPLGRLLPKSLGDKVTEALSAIGVALHLSRSVAKLEPGKALLDDGSEVAFDLALSAIGLLPRIELARQAGLAVDKGIVVNRLLQSTDPALYALGDCAQTDAGPLPFVLPLMAQARALAATLAGKETPLMLPAMPVVVKTPALPVAVCPPPFGVQGDWSVEGEGRDLKALFLDGAGTAVGFALSGARVAERQTLGKSMPDVLG